MTCSIRLCDVQHRLIKSAHLIAFLFIYCSAAIAETGNNSKPPETNDYTVTGHVKDESGHGIADATVEWGSDKTRFSARQRATTEKDGAYKLVIKKLRRQNHFAASAPGYLTVVVDTQLVSGQQVRDFVLRATSATEHVVAGTVVDEKGSPIAGVRVEAFTPVEGFISSFSMPTGRDYFPGPDRVATTDNLGRFYIVGISTDKVQLSLRSKHRHVNDENYPVAENVRITMTGSGQPGVIQGRVIDKATNLPPQNIHNVRIVSRYSTTNHKCSDDDGHFQLPTEATLGNEYLVYVYAKGYAVAQSKLTGVQSGANSFVDIKLTKAPTVRGKLLDARTGEPVKRADLLYGIAEGSSYVQWSDLQKYADGYHSLKFVQHVTTDDAGEFWLAEPENDARGMIIALIPGYQRLILKPDAREVDAATGEIVVRLKRESAFVGVVMVDGKLLSDVSVGVTKQSREEDPMQMPESVRTDAHGKYKYGSLGPGRFQIHGGPYTRVATIGEDETVFVHLGQGIGQIRIHGKATPNSSINVCPMFDWDYVCLTAKANDGGDYELRGLKPGKYRVSISSGFQGGFRSDTETFEIDVDRDDQEVDLLSKHE